MPLTQQLTEAFILRTKEKIMNNKTKTKKNPAPVLACIITGQARKTSHNYLNDKAKRLGVASDWLLNNYVSKFICSQLRAGKALSDLQTTDLHDLARSLILGGFARFSFRSGLCGGCFRLPPCSGLKEKNGHYRDTPLRTFRHRSPLNNLVNDRPYLIDTIPKSTFPDT